MHRQLLSCKLKISSKTIVHKIDTQSYAYFHIMLSRSGVQLPFVSSENIVKYMHTWEKCEFLCKQTKSPTVFHMILLTN